VSQYPTCPGGKEYYLRPRLLRLDRLMLEFLSGLFSAYPGPHDAQRSVSSYFAAKQPAIHVFVEPIEIFLIASIQINELIYIIFKKKR
jgi:hypothetical protein